MQDGWHVVGAGKDLTTVYQSGGTAAYNLQLFANADGRRTRMSVEDLTIDCAYFRLRGIFPNATYAGVQLSGQSYIRNVRVKNWGGDTAEAFALCIVSYGPPWPDGAFIDNCEVINPAPQHSTALLIANYGSLGPPYAGTPTYARGAAITNCYVNGAKGGAHPPEGFDGGQISGCTFVGCYYSIYSDTFPSTNISITNNVISGQQHGIYFNNNNFSGITVSGNTINVPWDGIAFCNVVTNSVISGNRIMNPGGGLPYGIGLNGAGVRGITVSDNVVDVSSIFLNTAVSVHCHNNLTPSGALWIPDIP
jgi:hypothetical protein